MVFAAKKSQLAIHTLFSCGKTGLGGFDMTVPYRPLGYIREVLESMGLDVTYAYDDLVYVEHNSFLLRMAERGELVYLYFNTESTPEERDGIAEQLREAGRQRELDIVRKGTYTMTSNPEDETISMRFFEGQF